MDILIPGILSIKSDKLVRDLFHFRNKLKKEGGKSSLSYVIIQNAFKIYQVLLMEMRISVKSCSCQFLIMLSRARLS